MTNNVHLSMSPSSIATPAHPDPQVRQRASRRRVTSAEKLRIFEAVDPCMEPGQLDALLRSEGIYSSHLTGFRKQRDEGKPGRDPDQVRRQRLEKEAARQRDARKIASLAAENRKLKVLLDLQKSCRVDEPAAGGPDRRLKFVQEAAGTTGVEAAPGAAPVLAQVAHVEYPCHLCNHPHL